MKDLEDGRSRFAPRRGSVRRAASISGSRWLAVRGAAWVERRRRAHRPFAQPLAPDVRRAFERHFEPETLAVVRVHEIPRIGPPWPLVLWRRLRPRALDLGPIWGITYVDTVVLATDVIDGLRLETCLFHECVHVAQYRLYGSVGFVRRYIREWVEAGWRYRGIGLEREAYTLQRRFAAGEAFRVEEELRPGIARGAAGPPQAPEGPSQ